jgi:hypothetical protein
MGKKTIEQEINEFLEYFDCKKLTEFLSDIIPLFELYNVDEENDWVKNAVGEEAERNVRLIRTVYLMSRIAENHSGCLATIKANHKKIWQRLENIEV